MLKSFTLVFAALFLLPLFSDAQKYVLTPAGAKIGRVAGDTAQTPKDTLKHKKASFKIGLNYSTNSVYLARTDSVATPNYNAGITYTLKSGIFFEGAVSYVPGRQFNKLDAGNLETGYKFDLDNLSGGVSVSKYFAGFNSTQVISALDATIGAELSYDLFNVITPSVHVDYALVRSNGGNDIIVVAALGHEFEMQKIFSKGDHLSIEPKIELTAGTQNFTTTYYILKQNGAAQRQQHQNSKGVGKGLSKTTTTSNTLQSNPVTTNTNKFQTLAYEFTLPFVYSYKKLGFSVIPAFAVALHKIEDDGSNTYNLPDSSVSYLQVGVFYTF